MKDLPASAHLISIRYNFPVRTWSSTSARLSPPPLHSSQRQRGEGLLAVNHNLEIICRSFLFCAVGQASTLIPAFFSLVFL